MSVELLRRAAKALREHAAKAQADEWFAAGPWMDDCPLELAEQLPLGFVAAGVECVPVVLAPPFGELPSRASLDYIALMHPPVALALADLLDTAAFVAEGHGLVDDDRYKDENALAHAILREEP